MRILSLSVRYSPFNPSVLRSLRCMTVQELLHLGFPVRGATRAATRVPNDVGRVLAPATSESSPPTFLLRPGDAGREKGLIFLSAAEDPRWCEK